MGRFRTITAAISQHSTFDHSEALKRLPPNKNLVVLSSPFLRPILELRLRRPCTTCPHQAGVGTDCSADDHCCTTGCGQLAQGAGSGELAADHRLPIPWIERSLLVHDRINQHQEFACGRTPRHFARLASCTQPLVQCFDDRIEPRGIDRGAI